MPVLRSADPVSPGALTSPIPGDAPSEAIGARGRRGERAREPLAQLVVHGSLQGPSAVAPLPERPLRGRQRPRPEVVRALRRPGRDPGGDRRRTRPALAHPDPSHRRNRAHLPTHRALAAPSHAPPPPPSDSAATCGSCAVRSPSDPAGIPDHDAIQTGIGSPLELGIPQVILKFLFPVNVELETHR